MNELNYASFEACKRLVKAGIVLETEAGWYKIFRPGCHAFDMVLSMRSGNEKFYGDNYPAPSMAEVWRELPFQSYIKKLDDGSTLVWICDDDADGKYIESNMIANTNPTDALIDLLIWVREQNKDRIVNKLLDRADKLKW